MHGDAILPPRTRRIRGRPSRRPGRAFLLLAGQAVMLALLVAVVLASLAVARIAS